MKYFSAIILSLALFGSISAFSATKRILPFPQPNISCVSDDGAFILDIYKNLRMIRVFDVAQNRHSHSVKGIVYKSNDNIVKLINKNGANGLANGVIFEADMNLTQDNGFILEDGSRYDCVYR